MNESLLSVRNASGKHVSLLNCVSEESKRKYRCGEPGCIKSFTTRTHMSPKSRRSPKKEVEEVRPKPHLHAHQRIRSDTIQMEPLTIDQHLSNYRQTSQKSTDSTTSDRSIFELSFYKHRPLNYTISSSSLPCTLLHPNQPQSNIRSIKESTPQDDAFDTCSDKTDTDLLHLAHIVSTLG